MIIIACNTETKAGKAWMGMGAMAGSEGVA